MCYSIIKERRKQPERETKGMVNMIKLNIQAITEMGSCVYTSIKVSEDYTMNEVVREIKRLGYKYFRLLDNNMRFVKVN